MTNVYDVKFEYKKIANNERKLKKDIHRKLKFILK